ncbi:MAG: phosphatidylglycerophosphatase A [Methanomicrobiales archaeon]|nr:phosphatidylglycerophosphatase A [Methanomicrobiales archaeon]
MFGVEERLKGHGAGIPEIVAAGMLLYVPHGIPPPEAEGILARKITLAFDDPNVSSLLLGAILLEEAITGRRDGQGIDGDPVYLLSDEILGLAIAEYLGGTRARFEFTRYDQKKPGILSRLGPFIDDAVAGLIAGCTSRLYSECTGSP